MMRPWLNICRLCPARTHSYTPGMNLLLMVLSGTLLLTTMGAFLSVRRLEQSLQELRVEVRRFPGRPGPGTG